MSGTAVGTVRRVTTGQSYINNKLFTASSAAERKLCANADWLSKGNAALGDGVLKGISQAVTDIWNQSMSASPIGKLFPEPGKKSGPGIGNTVMEITERVVKEQEQRKEQERIWESRYELRYGEESREDTFITVHHEITDQHYLYTEEKTEEIIKTISKFDSEIENFKMAYKNNKDIYENISKKAGVPPELIAVLHYRENTSDYLNGYFQIYLHNGDPLGVPTIHYPSGKMFNSFDDAAVDAFNDKQGNIEKYCLSSDTKDIVAMMSFAEAYNGMGYYNNGYDNPYLYSGTNQYTSGKYIERPNENGKMESVYDPNVIDEQVGVYLLLDSLLNE